MLNQNQPDFHVKSQRPSRWPTVALILTGAAALALAVFAGGEDGGTVVGIGIVHAILFVIGALCAALFQKRIDKVDVFSVFFLWFPVLLLYFAWTAARDGVRSSLLLIAGVLLIRLGIVNSVFNLAKIRSGAKRIARRKSLASARAFFAKELRRTEPRLKDEWFPYVVAFGLTSDADRWFRAHGAAAAAAGSSSWSGSTSSSSSRRLRRARAPGAAGAERLAAPARREPGPWRRAGWQPESPRPLRRAAGAAGAGVAAGEARAGAAGEAGRGRRRGCGGAP